MRFPVVTRLKHVLLVGIVAVASLAAVTGTASAATNVLSNTVVVCGGVSSSPAGDGALTLHYCGHNYTCYYHDLCLYRGGRFEAYFKCQTVINPTSTTAYGWAWNNESSGTAASKATFSARPGYTGGSLLAPWPGMFSSFHAAVYWRGVASFHTCFD